MMVAINFPVSLFLCLFVCLMIHYHNNYYVMYILFMVLLMFVLLLHVIRFFSNCYKNVMVYKNGPPMSPPTNVNVASGTNNWGLRLNLPKPPLWRSASMGDQQEDGWRYSLIWPCPPGVRKIMKHLEIFLRWPILRASQQTAHVYWMVRELGTFPVEQDPQSDGTTGPPRCF